MQPDEPTEATFYFEPLKCHLTTGTFICYTPRLCGEDEVVGLVLQIQLNINDSPCLLHVQQYVFEDYHCIQFHNLSDMSIVKDSLKEVIETDRAAMIVIRQVKGLAFVCSLFSFCINRWRCTLLPKQSHQILLQHLYIFWQCRWHSTFWSKSIHEKFPIIMLPRVTSWLCSFHHLEGITENQAGAPAFTEHMLHQCS